MTLKGSQTALKAATIITIGFGIMMTFSLFTPLNDVMLLFLDMALWPVDGTQIIDAVETRLLIGISAGVLAGWGVMIWFIITEIYSSNPKLGGRMILVSICTWFLLDSFGSIMAGAPVNAVLNLFFLAIFALPVLLYKPDTK